MNVHCQSESQTNKALEQSNSCYISDLCIGIRRPRRYNHRIRIYFLLSTRHVILQCTMPPRRGRRREVLTAVSERPAVWFQDNNNTTQITRLCQGYCVRGSQPGHQRCAMVQARELRPAYEDQALSFRAKPLDFLRKEFSSQRRHLLQTDRQTNYIRPAT